MNTKQAMKIAGQHASSNEIRKAISEGMKITDLWTNKKVGDRGVSVVEFDCGTRVAYVHNAGVEWLADPFDYVVEAAEEQESYA